MTEEISVDDLLKQPLEDLSFGELRKVASELDILERTDTADSLRQKIELALTEFVEEDDRAEETRARTRKPLVGGHNYQLDVPDWIQEKLEGYHLRFFTRQRVRKAYDAGFKPVLENGAVGNSDTSDNEWYTYSKGYKEDGSPSTNFLMAQPIEFYEEDKAARDRELEAIDQAIEDGTPTGQETDANYIPREGAKVSQPGNIFSRT